MIANANNPRGHHSSLLLDPFPSLRLSHFLRHHREPRDIRVLTRLGDVGRIINPERPQADALPFNVVNGTATPSRYAPFAQYPYRFRR